MTKQELYDKVFLQTLNNCQRGLDLAGLDFEENIEKILILSTVWAKHAVAEYESTEVF